MKKLITSLFVAFSIFSLSAQDQLNQLEKYFENDVENIYVHTNKNKYVEGENLWFKAYVFNVSQNAPSLEAISAEVNLYNDQKELVSTKKYIVTNGVFTGDFKIDSTFTGGKYYLQAHTDLMKKQGIESHVQDFNIVDLALKDEIDYASDRLNLKILPEGGHAVYGLDSSFGLKLINKKGLGESFTAQILENDKPINELKSNLFGHAKFKLNPKSNSIYKIKILTDKGIQLSQNIENIDQEGATIQLNALVPNVLYFQLEKNYTNDSSDYSMVINQLQKGKKIDFNFDEPKTQLAVTKEELFKGMNTIRIFKDGVPILERLYFEKTGDVIEFEGNIIESTKKINDSISLELIFPFVGEQKMLSVSILPTENVSYTKSFNIISQFRLASHLKGNIENEAYYFEGNSTQKTYDLDLLLITQGWSKYAWKEIAKEPKIAEAKRKNGMRYKLLLDEKPKSTDEFLLFHGSVFNKAKAIEIDRKTTLVEFPNMYPVVGEKFKFSYVNSSKNYKAPRLSFEMQDFVIDTLLKDNLPLQQSNLGAEFVKLNYMSEAFIDTEVLNEVVIIGAKKKEEEKSRTRVGETYYKIDDKEILHTRTLALFLTKRGFRVLERPGELSITPMRQSSIGSGGGVAVYLDGALLANYDFLSNTSISQFESIIINKNGFGQGLFGADGAIYLESRKSSFLNDKSNEMFTEIEVDRGYESSKEFYNPIYQSYDNLFFKKYGTISWTPQVLINNENAKLELRFKKTNLDYTLYVEGMDSSGKLYSYKIDRKAEL